MADTILGKRSAVSVEAIPFNQFDVMNTYIEAVYGRRAVYGTWSTFVDNARKSITKQVLTSIYKYGDAGCCDKPQGMHTFEYWLHRLPTYKNVMPAGTHDWSGKVVCFTGNLGSMKKAKAEQLVKDAGRAVSKSITKKTTHLVFCGNFGTQKVRDATIMDIPMVVGEDFVASFAPNA